MKTPTTLYRTELYAAVWSTPVNQLATQYGLKDGALRRICRMLEVPTPYSGYWSKLWNGQNPAKTLLSVLPAGRSDRYDVEPRDTVSYNPAPPGDPASPSKPSRRLAVPRRLTAPHPVVQATRDAFAQPWQDRYGRPRPRRDGVVDIVVYKPMVERALRIADAVVKEADRRGWEVVPRGRYEAVVHLKVEGELVGFRIIEKAKRIKHVPKSGTARAWDREFDYEPCGTLTLTITNDFLRIGRVAWSDTARARVEDWLDDFMEAVARAGEHLKKERLRHEEAAQRWKIEEERRREDERQRQLEEGRRKRLEEEALLWTKSQHIYRFIAEVERVATLSDAAPSDAAVESREVLSEWIGWARRHAERIDPLASGLPHERWKESHQEGGNSADERGRVRLL
jgi:hypothetical protein